MEPFDQRKTLGKNTAHLVNQPKDCALYADLLIGDADIAADCPLPLELFGGTTMWSHTLGDKRRVALVARVRPFNEEDTAALAYFHEQLRMTITGRDASPSTVRAELLEVRHSDGHNFISVAPLEARAIRSEDEPQTNLADREPLACEYRTSLSEASLSAPDGSVVVSIRLTECSENFELRKGEWRSQSVGRMHFQLQLENLGLGSGFIAQPSRLDCPPTLNGAKRRDWAYPIAGKFDGEMMVVEVRKLATALINDNLDPTIPGLADDEEIAMSIPTDSLNVMLTASAPESYIDLIGRFSLRSRS